jgi:hypothetical protein
LPARQAPISGARAIHSVNGVAKNVSSTPSTVTSNATTAIAETAVGILYLTPNSVAGLSVMPTMSAAVTGSRIGRPK